jgi:hypothetical protein
MNVFTACDVLKLSDRCCGAHASLDFSRSIEQKTNVLLLLINSFRTLEQKSSFRFIARCEDRFLLRPILCFHNKDGLIKAAPSLWPIWISTAVFNGRGSRLRRRGPSSSREEGAGAVYNDLEVLSLRIKEDGWGWTDYASLIYSCEGRLLSRRLLRGYTPHLVRRRRWMHEEIV